MATPQTTPEVSDSGPIAWMARNTVAANLLMFIILVGGALGILRTKQEVFPAFEADLVSISVPYPGASPAEVEQGVVLAVEEAVRGVDGIKKVTSTSSDNLGSISVELLLGANKQQALADIKSKVDAITSFPVDSERPQVSLISPRREVVSLVISGELPEASLFALAEKARQELLDLDGVTQVDVFGTRPLEVSIEISRENLRAYGWSLDEIAQQVAASSLELPAGALDTSRGEVMVRVYDRALTARQFEGIVLRANTSGAIVRLGDVATIVDGFEDIDLASRFNGEPAVRVTAYRVGAETPGSVAKVVRGYADDLRASLPDTVRVDIWNDDSELLQGRIDLLVNNALLGLVLVFAVLAAFLDFRLALWVALGIPISFMGAFLLMPGADVSINMISLFAFIVVLGLVVDDAIVVGENIHEKTETGMPRLQAAIEGAREMAVPVTFSILTTIVAFLPLGFLPGVSGKIFGIFPVVVIAVLLFSLVESFFILPAHLGHGQPSSGPGFILFRPLLALQRAISGGLDSFIARVYRPVLEVALRLRYITLGGAIAFGLIGVFGVLGGGVVPFTFFPKLEGDVVIASARLPYGVPIEQTKLVQGALERGAQVALDGTGETAILKGMFTRLGEGASTGGGPVGPTRAAGSHLVSVELQLVSAERRKTTSEQLAAAWLVALPPLPGVEALSVSSAVGPGAGAAVDVQLSHPDTEVLAVASNELTSLLKQYSDLKDVTNSYAAGKPQLNVSLLPEAQATGLTAVNIARQLRAAFFGAEAIREQRGRNEVKVMARLPEDQRASTYDLDTLRVKTPSGDEVPLRQVAEVEPGTSPTMINRRDGRRVVNVTAELSATAQSSAAIVTVLTEELLPDLIKRHPGLLAGFGGEQESQAETFAALGMNFLLALFVIYALLAIPFKSYTQPIIIMAVIPFGLVGAVLGHLVMGYGMSVISVMGVFALTGVVVNDSLVLIDAANGFRREGATPNDAIMRAGMRRLRPIFLTSFTTFVGLAPMIAETSVQARFLIPMAISLGFGVLFATVVTLLLVPAIYMVLDDVVNTLLALWRLGSPPARATNIAGEVAPPG